MDVDAISENPFPPPPPTAEELLRLAGLDNEIAGDLPDYEEIPLQNIQPNLSEVAEPVVPESVAPTTATENENDKESSLPRERFVNCFSSDTNLTKIHLASKLSRRSYSLQMYLAHWRWLVHGKDIPFLVPCEYIWFIF